MRKNLMLWEVQSGLKAIEIAKMLGITQATYCNIKYGKSTPSLDFAYKFIEVFPDVDVLELLRKED